MDSTLFGPAALTANHVNLSALCLRIPGSASRSLPLVLERGGHTQAFGFEVAKHVVPFRLGSSRLRPSRIVLHPLDRRVNIPTPHNRKTSSGKGF